jgi:predicted MFS family arabinose efflux permease
VTALACLCYPLAAGPRPVAAAVLLAGELLTGFAVVNLDINQVSLRQALTPEGMLGRTGASGRFITWGVRPFGALLGGWLGTAFGLRATLAVGAGGGLLAVFWLWLSPLPALRTLPARPLEEPDWRASPREPWPAPVPVAAGAAAGAATESAPARRPRP